MRITDKGIANVRPSGDISSYYLWEDIQAASLASLESFSIVYRDASHPYVYSSPNALQIVQCVPVFGIGSNRDIAREINSRWGLWKLSSIELPEDLNKEQTLLRHVSSVSVRRDNPWLQVDLERRVQETVAGFRSLLLAPRTPLILCLELSSTLKRPRG